jgi:hypothetical protein
LTIDLVRVCRVDGETSQIATLATPALDAGQYT